MSILIKQAPTDEFRLGLEKEGLQLYEQATSSYEIPYVNGKFNHSLTKDQQKIVESYFGHKFDDPASKDFWSSMHVEIPHTIKVIDFKNANDLLLYGIMKSYGILAPSTEAALTDKMSKYVFMVQDDHEEEQVKATLNERRDVAIISINDIRSKSKPYLIALAQYIFNELGIESDTLAYNKLREFIDGQMLSLSKTKKGALEIFEKALEIEKAKLYVIMDVRKAVAKNIIRKDANQRFYNSLNGATYGKTLDDVVEYLMRPENTEELGSMNSPHPTSIRAQLKNRG